MAEKSCRVSSYFPSVGACWVFRRLCSVYANLQWSISGADDDATMAQLVEYRMGNTLYLSGRSAVGCSYRKAFAAESHRRDSSNSSRNVCVYHVASLWFSFEQHSLELDPREYSIGDTSH